MEYVYQLNLPPLNEVLREDVMHRYEQGYDNPKFDIHVPSELLKPEFLIINGFEWELAIDFYKPINYKGIVHIDISDKSLCAWGINWVWNAAGAINYWHPENISPNKLVPAAAGGKPLWNYPTDIPYDISYNMDPGVYLVNASIPHQPISLGSRHCISLRPSTYDIPWEQVVDRFKGYII